MKRELLIEGKIWIRSDVVLREQYREKVRFLTFLRDQAEATELPQTSRYVGAKLAEARKKYRQYSGEVRENDAR